MEEILHHMGCITPGKEWNKLPTSTGDRRISEPSTVLLIFTATSTEICQIVPNCELFLIFFLKFPTKSPAAGGSGIGAVQGLGDFFLHHWLLGNELHSG